MDSYEDYNKRFESLVADLRASLEKYAKIEAAHKQFVEQAEENVRQSEERIVLDIGGTRFTTSKETLMKYPDSYFGRLLRSSDKYKPDKDGSYFVDRDPQHFSSLLNFMRSGGLNLNGYNEVQLGEINEEIDYYGLWPTKEDDDNEISLDENRKGPHVQVANGQAVNLSNSHQAILGSFNSSNNNEYSYWEVILKGRNVVNGGWVRVGLANRDNFTDYSDFIGSNANTYAIRSSNNTQGANSDTQNNQQWKDGDKIGVAFNRTNGLVRFYYNGTYTNCSYTLPNPQLWDPAFSLFNNTISFELVNNPTCPTDLP